MRLPPRSLFGRLVLILITGLLIAQFISTAVLLWDREQILREQSGLELVERIVSVVQLLEDRTGAHRETLLRAISARGFRVTLTATPPPFDASADTLEPLALLLRQALRGYDEIRVVISRRDDWRPMNQRPRFADMPRMHGPRGPRIGFHAQIRLKDGVWVSFHKPIAVQEQFWTNRVFVYLAVLLLSVIVLSLLAVRLATRPLAVMANAADGLGRDIQQPPLEEAGPDEVRKAATAFNTMQRRLRRFIDDRSSILSSISHDLKTPITRLRLRTELLDDPGLRQKFDEDLNAMEQMVSSTLDFMRGTESKERPVEIDVAALLESLCDDMRDMGWRVTLVPAEIIPYRGRPQILTRCLTNLIENAARYGSEAIVSARDAPGMLTIIVGDNGPGVPESELESLFKPFYRREESRNRETGGTGLGLGIARNIARAHGGDVVLRPRETGGLEAVVTLPR